MPPAIGSNAVPSEVAALSSLKLRLTASRASLLPLDLNKTNRPQHSSSIGQGCCKSCVDAKGFRAVCSDQRYGDNRLHTDRKIQEQVKPTPKEQPQASGRNPCPTGWMKVSDWLWYCDGTKTYAWVRLDPSLIDGFELEFGPTPPPSLPKVAGSYPPLGETKTKYGTSFADRGRCGPDVTDILVRQLIQLLRVGIFDAFGMLSSGGACDIKSKGLTASSGFDSCPHNCPNSLTLCGYCLEHNMPGDIAWGWYDFVGKYQISQALELMETQSLDSASETAAIGLGEEMRGDYRPAIRAIAAAGQPRIGSQWRWMADPINESLFEENFKDVVTDMIKTSLCESVERRIAQLNTRPECSPCSIKSTYEW